MFHSLGLHKIYRIALRQGIQRVDKVGQFYDGLFAVLGGFQGIGHHQFHAVGKCGGMGRCLFPGSFLCLLLSLFHIFFQPGLQLTVQLSDISVTISESFGKHGIPADDIQGQFRGHIFKTRILRHFYGLLNDFRYFR